MIAELLGTLVLSHLRAGSREGLLGTLVATLTLFCTLGPNACQTAPLPDVFSYRPESIAELRRGFSHPPIEARPWVIWFWWNGVLERDEITRQLREIAAAGFGGAEIRCVTFHGWGGEPLQHMDAASLTRIGHKQVEYLSEEFIDLLEHTCETAKSLDVRLSINMGQGWPPGGPWITDEHRTKLLSWTSREVEGPSDFVEQEVPAGSFALAWRIIDDGGEKSVDEASFQALAIEAKATDGGSTLRWQVPEGKWLIGIFHVTPGGIADKGDGPEVDPASREAVLFHLNYFFGRIDPTLRRFYGETLVEIASDSWEYLHHDKRYWSPAIVESFTKLAGYDVRKKLHVLLGYGPETRRVLRDLEAVESSLVHENFFATVRDFLHARGLRHRPQVYGRGLPRDFHAAYALSDIPEVEAGILLPEAPWAAHAVGNPLVTAEAFTFLSQKYEPIRVPSGLDETTPALLRWHANHYYGEGINRLNMHSYSYSPPQLPLPGWKMYAEIHLNRTVPWWPMMPSLTTWMARNQWCLQSGMPVAEVLVYPVESNPPEGPYNVRTDQPISAANGVVGVNDATLPLFVETAMRSGVDTSVSICVLTDPTSASAVQALLGLTEMGGTMTYCGPPPEEWTALNSPRSNALWTMVRKLRADGRLVDGRKQGWRQIVEQGQHVRWPSEANLVSQHRRLGDVDLYFIVNYGEPFSGQISFPHPDQQAEVWDADTGNTKFAARMAVRDGRALLRSTLGHFESTLIVFSVAERVAAPTRVADELDGESTLENVPAPVSLGGPWRLQAPAELAVSEPPSEVPTQERLVSWRAMPELKNFAGTVAYTSDFNMPAEQLQSDLLWQLELGQVFEVARVWVNDVEAGVAWTPPFRLPVTSLLRPGKNTIRIEVANLLKNHLDRGPEYTRPSGLLGPVTLVPQRRRVIASSSVTP